jgi:hypothetical protein
MIASGPYRTRQILLESVKISSGVYFGPTSIRTKGPFEFRNGRFWQFESLRDGFPRIFSWKISWEQIGDVDKKDPLAVIADRTLEVKIPIFCRMAAFFEDFDYLAPIWLNVLTIGLYIFWPGTSRT